MALKPPNPGDVEQGQRELREKLLADPVVATIANAANVAMLVDVIHLEYPKGSGILYSVDGIPYPDGLRVLDIYTRIQESRKHKDNQLLDVYSNLLREFLDIAWNLMKPNNAFKRVLKFIGVLRNPLYNASEGDIGDLLGFFVIRRMKSNVKFRYPASENQDQPTS